MTESTSDLRKRLDTAKNELADSDWFDFSIINEDDGIEEVVNQIIQICSNIQSNNKSKEYFHD